MPELLLQDTSPYNTRRPAAAARAISPLPGGPGQPASVTPRRSGSPTTSRHRPIVRWNPDRHAAAHGRRWNRFPRAALTGRSMELVWFEEGDAVAIVDAEVSRHPRMGRLQRLLATPAAWAAPAWELTRCQPGARGEGHRIAVLDLAWCGLGRVRSSGLGHSSSAPSVGGLPLGQALPGADRHHRVGEPRCGSHDGPVGPAHGRCRAYIDEPERAWRSSWPSRSMLTGRRVAQFAATIVRSLQWRGPHHRRLSGQLPGVRCRPLRCC